MRPRAWLSGEGAREGCAGGDLRVWDPVGVSEGQGVEGDGITASTGILI